MEHRPLEVSFCPHRLNISTSPWTSIQTTELEAPATFKGDGVAVTRFTAPVTFTGTMKDLDLLEACRETQEDLAKKGRMYCQLFQV